MESTESLVCPDFTQVNSLIYRRSTSHQIINLRSPEKNIQLKFIILSKLNSFRTKNSLITQCQIADDTASIIMNFYNQSGQLLEQGDICYVSGAYTSFYKGMIVLYQGQSIIRRIGKWYMKFNNKINISRESLIDKEKQRQKMEQEAQWQEKLQKNLKFADER